MRLYPALSDPATICCEPSDALLLDVDFGDASDMEVSRAPADYIDAKHMGSDIVLVRNIGSVLKKVDRTFPQQYS